MDSIWIVLGHRKIKKWIVGPLGQAIKLTSIYDNALLHICLLTLIHRWIKTFFFAMLHTKKREKIYFINLLWSTDNSLVRRHFKHISCNLAFSKIAGRENTQKNELYWKWIWSSDDQLLFNAKKPRGGFCPSSTDMAFIPSIFIKTSQFFVGESWHQSSFSKIVATLLRMIEIGHKGCWKWSPIFQVSHLSQRNMFPKAMIRCKKNPICLIFHQKRF